MNTKGYVYVMKNSSMPGVWKVGYSVVDPATRARDLDKTGSPSEYDVVFSAYLDNPRKVEHYIHNKIDMYRVRSNREWFEISWEKLINIVRYSIQECGGAYFTLNEESQHPLGYVYIITNPLMPGLVKIGFTKNHPEERAKELDDTGVAQEYLVKFYIIVKEYKKLEKKIHAHLSNSRVRSNREWFSIDIEDAICSVLILSNSYKPIFHYICDSVKRSVLSEVYFSYANKQTNILKGLIEDKKVEFKSYCDKFRENKINEINKINKDVFEKDKFSKISTARMELNNYKNNFPNPSENMLTFTMLGVFIGIFMSGSAAILGGIIGFIVGFFRDSDEKDRLILLDAKYKKFLEVIEDIENCNFEPNYNIQIDQPLSMGPNNIKDIELLNEQIKKINITMKNSIEYLSEYHSYSNDVIKSIKAQGSSAGIKSKTSKNETFSVKKHNGSISVDSSSLSPQFNEKDKVNNKKNNLYFDKKSKCELSFSFSGLLSIEQRDIALDVYEKNWVLIPSQRKLINTKSAEIFINNGSESFFSEAIINEERLVITVYTYDDFYQDISYRIKAKETLRNSQRKPREPQTSQPKNEELYINPVGSDCGNKFESTKNEKKGMLIAKANPVSVSAQEMEYYSKTAEMSGFSWVFFVDKRILYWHGGNATFNFLSGIITIDYKFFISSHDFIVDAKEVLFVKN